MPHGVSRLLHTVSCACLSPEESFNGTNQLEAHHRPGEKGIPEFQVPQQGTSGKEGRGGKDLLAFLRNRLFLQFNILADFFFQPSEFFEREPPYAVLV